MINMPFCATRQAQSAGKHRYDTGEVIANFDYAELVKKIGLEVEQAKAERAVKPEVLLDMLYTGAITKREENFGNTVERTGVIK